MSMQGDVLVSPPYELVPPELLQFSPDSHFLFSAHSFARVGGEFYVIYKN